MSYGSPAQGITAKPNVNIKVLIPVKIGGYTGQRDAFEEYMRDHDVSVEGDYITLTSQDSTKRKVTFAKGDLDAALRALNMHAGPVYRNSTGDVVGWTPSTVKVSEGD